MPESGQKFYWSNLTITLSAGIGAFILYCGLVGTVVTQSLFAFQWTKLNALFAETEEIIIESKTAIDRLNAMGFDQCDHDTLVAMQKQLFLASRVRDIGFVKDNILICTTGRGVLQTPFEQQPWDFIGPTGYKYWAEVPMILFDNQTTAPLFGKGTFNVVIDTRWMKKQIGLGDRQELLFRNASLNFQFAYGDSGVFRGMDTNAAQAVSLSSIYSEACKDMPPFCAAIETNNLSILKNNLPFAILLLAIGLALGLVTGRIASQVLIKRRSIMNRVIRGLKKKAFYPLYQPIVDLHSGKIIGCEVLARFDDHLGPIYPDVFIPLLGQAHLSWPFTEVIIEKILSDVGSTANLPDGFKIHINLYPSDIALGHPIKSDIIQSLAKSRFKIAFEITEDEQLDTAAAQNCLKWIRENGIELSVDDFGTGYSNLSKVRDLGCSTLKIDRSFVFDIDAGGLGYALVPLMIKIGQELGMEIVSEGVETERQAEIVKAMGSQYAQGWAFGKPMTINELEKHLS